MEMSIIAARSHRRPNITKITVRRTLVILIQANVNSCDITGKFEGLYKNNRQAGSLQGGVRLL